MKKKFFSLLVSLLPAFIAFSQIPAGYYNNAISKTGETLRAALRDITTTGHVKIPYTSSSFDIWDAYAVTDTRPSNNTIIWDMYSDIPSGSPLYTFTLYTKQCGTAALEGDCYSREHQVPNSWWGGIDDANNPQYSDLHHLPPADQIVNSNKSAHPIGKVGTATWTSTNGSKVGPCSWPGSTGTVFEPIDEYKGDFARAYLYVATRYMNSISTWLSTYTTTEAKNIFTGNNFKPWFIDMLIQWCNNDPVSTKEINRNNAIYYNTPQHNRNPYIDHPEYVCLVWSSTSCNSAPSITSIIQNPLFPTNLNTVSVTATVNSSFPLTSVILEWGTNGTTFPNSITMNLGTGSNYTTASSIPVQSSGTTIYYRITALDNQAHSTTSAVTNYTVLKDEPTNYPTSFSCGSITSSSISLSWADATGSIIPDGYLVKASISSVAAIADPIDGTAEADGNFVKNISSATQLVAFSGLSSFTPYYFKIYPYTNSGTNINYKTSLTPPNTSCTTSISAGGTCATDLVISEYVEGSSNNKYIELYNGTGSAVDLSNYKLQLFANGGTTPLNNVTLSGTLNNLSTIVYKNSSAAVYTGTATANTALAFNGNDAVALFKISTSSYVDIFGRIGEDPGTAWTSGVFTTIDKTLVRNSNITSGVTANPASGFPTLATEWTQFNTDNVSNLGSHSMNCANCASPSLQASNISFTAVSETSMTINWTNGNGSKRLVVVKDGSPVTGVPSNSTGYSSNTAFGTGNILGAGEYIVYNASATSVTVTNLTGGHTYFVTIFEYNCSPGLELYLTPGASSSKITYSITTGTAPETQFCISATAGFTTTIDFSSTGTFSGNTYSVQLSDLNGSFASPVIIGTLSSNLNNETINCTIPANTPSGTGYMVRVISNGPSIIGSSSSPFEIILYSPGVAPTSAACNRPVICTADPGTISLSATGGFGSLLSWYSGSCGGTLVGTGNPLVINSPLSSTTYYARWSNTCSISNCASTNVVVNSRPTGVLSGGSSYCVGAVSPTILSIAATGTGPWSGTLSNGTVFNGSTSPITVSVTPSSTTTYTLAVLQDAICSAISGDMSGSAIVNVNPHPTGIISGGATYVAGAVSPTTLNISVTGTGPWSGTLSNGATFSGSISPLSVTVTPSTTTTYTIATLQDANCASNSGDLSGSATVTILKAEPTNYPTGFACGTITTSSITLTWTDAVGSTAPDGYIVKASSVSLAAITDPVDGTPESNGTLVKNVTVGTQQVVFSGLSPATTYFFKIYSYSNSGSNINYKISPAPPNASCTVASLPGGNCATDLIISEYVEGSSNNKYIELYNGTGGPVDLTNYKLRLFANGVTTPTNDITLSGTLNAQSTIVYKNTNATIYTGATIINAAVNFNGDDAVALYKISTGSYVDIFGRIGERPTNPSAWTSGSFGTLDRTLVRNASVTSGISVNPTAGFPTLSTEWTQFGVDVVTNLGSHTMTCSSCSSPSVQAGSITFSSVGQTSMTINWTNGNGSKRMAVVKDGSSVTGLPTNGTTYSANSVFGTGSTLNGTEYVVYNDVGSSVTITNLIGGHTYYVTIFEYNCGSGLQTYLTPGSSSSKTTYSITTGTITPNPICITATAGAAISINLNSTGTFTNNTYSAQLSDPNGSFASPLVIGSVLSNLNSETINCAIPANTPSGTGYLARVVSTGPVITGNTSNTFEIILSNITAPSNVSADRPIICASEMGNISLSANPLPGAVLSWFTGSCGGNPIGTGNPLVISAPASTTTYYARWSNSCSTSSCSNTTIIVKPLPTGILSGGASICQGQVSTTSLSIAVSGTGPWSGTLSNGATFNGTTSPITVIVSPASTTTYTLATLADAACTSVPANLSGSATVNINQRPTGIISGGAVYCKGSASTTTLIITVTGVGPWTGTLSNGTTFGGSTSPLSVSVAPDSTTTFSISTLSDANCASIPVDLSGSATITIHNRPTGLISGGASYCKGAVTTTSLNISVTGTGPWSGLLSDGTTFSGSISPIIVSLTPNATIIYSIASLQDVYCSSVPANLGGSATVNIKQRPTGIISGGAVYCIGSVSATTLSITVTGVGPWTGTLSDGTTFSGSTSPLLVSVTPDSTTTFTISTLSDANCASIPVDLSGSATITIHNRPTGLISGGASYCTGAVTTTSLNISVTGTGPWSGLLSDGTTFSGSISPIIVSVTPITSKTYTIASLQDAYCSSIPADLEGSATININAHPTGFISGGATYCERSVLPTALNIAVTGTGPWSGTLSDGTTFAGSVNPLSVIVAPTSTTTYTIANLQDAKCTALPAGMTGTATITVKPLTMVSFSGLAATYCTADPSVTLTANLPAGVFGISGTSSSAILNNGNGTAIFNPAVAGEGGPYSVTYSYTNSDGCLNSITKRVTISTCTTTVKLQLKVLLEGFLSDGTGWMSPNLYNVGNSSDSQEADTIAVNLWAPEGLNDPNPGYSFQSVLHIDGTDTLTLPGEINGKSFFIAIRQRNHVETWSKLPVIFSTTTNYDFTTGLSKAFDDAVNPPMAVISNGACALWAGDVTGDGGIDGQDMNEIDNHSGFFGYETSDITGDGGIDGQDMNYVDNNSQYNLFFARPYFYENPNAYYVSPSGNDSNAGTIESPFATIEKLNSVLVAGDTAFIRGGTYRSNNNAAQVHFWLHDLAGTESSPIYIAAYPPDYEAGNKPIFNLDNIMPTQDRPFGMALSHCTYVHMKGITIKNLKQRPVDGTGLSTGFSRGFYLYQSPHCKIELFEIFNIGGGGFGIEQSSGTYVLNTDVHHCGDGLPSSSSAFNGGDCYNATGGDQSTDLVFEGCRGWMTGDDIWDFFGWNGNKITLKNCWAFWASVKPWGINGKEPTEDPYNPSTGLGMTPNDASTWINPTTHVWNSTWCTASNSGEGFKLGGGTIAYGNIPAPNVTKKFLYNCLGFENRGNGFSANMQADASHRMLMENCAAFGNFDGGWSYGTGRSTGIAMIMKNCWAFHNGATYGNGWTTNGDWVYDGLPDSVSNNYWDTHYYSYVNYGNLKPTPISQLTDASFLSVSSAGVTGPRQADGSLPNLNFLKPAAGSPLIDKGINVGLPFNGASPDLGPFER